VIGMSKGRKWRVDLLSGNSAAVLVLGGLFLLGSMAGCITAGLFQDDQGLVRQSVSAACSAGVRPGFWLCLRGCGLWCLAALLLGFSALGVFGLPVLFLCRGFVLCYAVVCFIACGAQPACGRRLSCLACLRCFGCLRCLPLGHRDFLLPSLLPVAGERGSGLPPITVVIFGAARCARCWSSCALVWSTPAFRHY
jgi:hypothetical protein